MALRDFAEGIGNDEASVRAAFTEEWSREQFEGRINKLKLIKRRRHGTTNFDLLRARILASW